MSYQRLCIYIYVYVSFLSSLMHIFVDAYSDPYPTFTVLGGGTQIVSREWRKGSRQLPYSEGLNHGPLAL